jgi:hypothetical protein
MDIANMKFLFASANQNCGGTCPIETMEYRMEVPDLRIIDPDSIGAWLHAVALGCQKAYIRFRTFAISQFSSLFSTAPDRRLPLFNKSSGGFHALLTPRCR